MDAQTCGSGYAMNMVAVCEWACLLGGILEEFRRFGGMLEEFVRGKHGSG